MKLIKILMVFIISLSFSHASLSNFLDKAKIKNNLKDQIADLDVRFKIKLADLTLIDGINLSSRYRYEVEPSYQSNFYSRVDKWNLNTEIKIGDMVDDLPFFFNMDRNSEVIFVRQFKSQKKALSAKPYFINKIPYNAEKAIKHLNPGDFVAIPVRMNIILGANISSGIDNLSSNIQYIISGRFMLHIYKMKDQKVRVKLIVQKSNSLQSNTKADFDVDVFGVKILDRGIEQLFETDIFKLNLNKEKGNIFIVDYVFDLQDKDSKIAYNNLLGGTYKFKDVEIVVKSGNPESLSKRYYSTFEKAEKIATEDKDLSKNEKRIIRVFKGYNTYKIKSNKLKLGLIIASYGFGKKYTENEISHEKINGDKEYFYYPNFTIEHEQNLGVWPFKKTEKTYKSVFGLVPMDKEGKSEAYTDFGFTIDSRDNIFRPSERTRVQQIVKDTLPKTLYQEIDWKNWRKERKVFNGRFFYQVIVKSSAFNSFPVMTQKELKRKLKKYYKERKNLSKDPIYSAISGTWKFIKLDFLTKRLKIGSLSRRLHHIFYGDIDGKQKIKALMELRKNDYFQKIGIGFIISLIKENELHKHLYVELKVLSDKTKAVNYTVGTQNYSIVYKELQHIMNAIYNRSYDLRLNQSEVKYNGLSE